jgi:hypothetical protein
LVGEEEKTLASESAPAPRPAGGFEIIERSPADVARDGVGFRSMDVQVLSARAQHLKVKIATNAGSSCPIGALSSMQENRS